MKKIIISMVLIIVIVSIILITGFNKDESLESWAQLYEYKRDEVYPLIIGNYGYPYINGKVNDQNIMFCIDTGNMVGPMISATKAKELNLVTMGNWKFRDSSGLHEKVYNIYRAKRLEILDTVFFDLDMYQTTVSSVWTVPIKLDT